MSKLTRRDDGLFEVDGPMTFETASELLRQGTEAIKSARDIRIDLQSVQRIDSAGLALAIEWLRIAQREQSKLSIIGQSDQMKALVAASNLEALFEQDSPSESVNGE